MTKTGQNTFEAEAVQDRLFQALIEYAFDTIAIVDATGTFTYVSPSIERMMGWQPDELVGRSAFDFVHPEQLTWAEGMLKKVVGSRDSIERLEVEALHKDGSWRLLENAVQNRLHDPAVKGVVINYRDITDRRRWEDALRESEERYQKAFNSSPDGIAISRLRNGVFLDVNAGFEELTGFSREEMVGRSSIDLNHWQDPSDRERLVQILKEEGCIHGFQAEFLDRQGNVHVWQLSAELLVWNGETCMMAVSRDVTEEVMASEKLKRTSDELRDEHQLLLEKNVALRELLDHLQQDKSSYRHELSSGIDNLLRPLLGKLTANGGGLVPEDIDLLEQRVDMVGCTRIGEGRGNLAQLTRRERDVCGLIQKGLSSRVMAQTLGLSHETINKHRQSIRRKLQIDHRGINLTSYLRSR
jgi:PAS domain S-box-containing protein